MKQTIAILPTMLVLFSCEKEADEIGEIKYTYVRDLNDQRQPEVFNGSTLTYGLQDSGFDIYVNIHSYDIQPTSFSDTFIEWSRTNYTGHIKAEHLFNNTNWHCWDNQGNDIDCN